MSKLQQESLIRKEGLQYGNQERCRYKWAFQSTEKELEEIGFKAIKQEWTSKHGLLQGNVEQQNQPRLRRMWKAFTKFLSKLY